MNRKTSFLIYSFILIGFVLILINSCKKDKVPILTTSTVNNITQTTASCGGNITSDGGSTVTARGVCWSTSTTPTIANSKTTDGTCAGSFTSAITALTANTTYYVRAYATNSAGAGYGNSMSFTTPPNNGIIFNSNLTYGTVTDIDGNVYKTITIGAQTWMAENLKTTKYKSDTSIPLVTNSIVWDGLNTPAYCWYDNNQAAFGNTYGALYNWYAVNTGNLCPAGWHIPSDAEWTTLTDFLGGESVAGGKLKETGTTHWQEINTDATNESGFTALPGGYRNLNETFNFVGINGNWWTSTEENSTIAWSRYMYHGYSGVLSSYYSESYGYSVRCVRDL